MGKSWPGSDIDIFVHESEAPKIRKWLLYEDQVFAGCSAGYGCATNRDLFDYNVSHVEFYTNRDDSKYSYADAIDRGRRFKRHQTLPLSGYVEVCTNDGEPMPFQSFLDLGYFSGAYFHGYRIYGHWASPGSSSSLHYPQHLVLFP